MTQSYRQLTATVSLLESRLESSSLESNDEVFPVAAQCLYYHLLGKAYLQQHQQAQSKAYATFTAKCTKMMHDGVRLAVRQLEPAHHTRLLVIHTYCKVALEIAGQPAKAKFVAERSFEGAIAYDNALDEKALVVLQRLRDDFMSLDLDEISAACVDPEYRRSETYHDGLEEVQDLFSVEFGRTSPHQPVKAPDSPLAQYSSSLSPKLACARKIRRTINILRPVVLDVLPSSAMLLRALDQIFRTYIRGNALPAQQAGGNTVDFGGQTLSFRSFVLDGPYLSWRGFVSFLLDFAVAKPPKSSSKAGKHFLKAFNFMSAAVQSAATSSHDPLINMTDAAVLFLEASGSLAPVLTLNKFLRTYADMAKNPPPDPWVAIMTWAEDTTDQEWAINCGINFMQFVDCLGKIGVLGYSSVHFEEMLSTMPEKVEHFLSAYLGLADKRRWQQKVERKQEAIQLTMAQLTEKHEQKEHKSKSKGKI